MPHIPRHSDLNYRHREATKQPSPADFYDAAVGLDQSQCLDLNGFVDEAPSPTRYPSSGLARRSIKEKVSRTSFFSDPSGGIARKSGQAAR
jgi:hypothetical protein